MRKFIVLFVMAAVLLSGCFQVNAANSATSAQAVASVSSDGSCQVNMTLTVVLEEPVDKLYFPVPGNATGVSLNGSRVVAQKSDGVRKVNLSRLMGKTAGTFSFSIQYSLHDVIYTTEADTLELQLPLLNGFAYTIAAMQFTVTLPGEVEAKPAFVSGYHKASIEQHLEATVEGMTITGTTLRPLKDHETLTMHLAVTEELFPRTIVQTQSTTTAAIGMGVCGGLALILWLALLFNLPLGNLLPWKREETTEPPEGFDAGVIGSLSGLQGVDLSLTVLTWAELGYILIRKGRGGKLLLHKRMEMGNERCDLERQTFRKLFGSRQEADTSTYSYAQLQRVLASRPGRMKEMLRRSTAGGIVFRILASGVGLFGGVGVGLMLGNGGVLQGFLMVVLGILGALSGYMMIPWAGGLRLRKKLPFWYGLGLGALWLLLGLLSGAFALSCWMVGGLLFAGVLLRIGGGRTELGKQTCEQLRGLRRYLRGADKAALRQRLGNDPDYFFRMFPYAMALGVDRSFAAAFGSSRLDDCPYLRGTGREGLTAMQWRKLLRRTVWRMEDRARMLPLEKVLGMLHSITRR